MFVRHRVWPERSAPWGHGNLFRVAQGVFGAPLIPLSQSVMVDIFPKHERGKAMALWGVGLMLAPVLGPTLGGYITQHLSWRWVFYINVPVGLLNLVLISRLVAPTTRRKIPMDWIGATVMAIGSGPRQSGRMVWFRIDHTVNGYKCHRFDFICLSWLTHTNTDCKP